MKCSLGTESTQSSNDQITLVPQNHVLIKPSSLWQLDSSCLNFYTHYYQQNALISTLSIFQFIYFYFFFYLLPLLTYNLTSLWVTFIFCCYYQIMYPLPFNSLCIQFITCFDRTFHLRHVYKPLTIL